MFRDYKNYEVFADGRIWSKKYKKFLKPYKQKNGYLQVRLSDNEGKPHTVLHHKVVYFAVNNIWDYPEGMQINHIDENKENNHISNLELLTSKENNNHGTHNERSAASRSKRVGAYKNNELIMVFESTNEAGRNGYASGAVSRCCRGERKTHKGFTWKYLDE